MPPGGMAWHMAKKHKNGIGQVPIGVKYLSAEMECHGSRAGNA
jgi:hypothetical protein